MAASDEVTELVKAVALMAEWKKPGGATPKKRSTNQYDTLCRVATLIADLAARLDAAEADRDALITDQERQSVIEADIAGGIDRLDQAGDHWLELCGVKRMVQAITSVFVKYANDDIMNRYQEKVIALMHQAFVEGAMAGSQVSGRAGLQMEQRATTAEAERVTLHALCKANNALARIEAAGRLTAEAALARARKAAKPFIACLEQIREDESDDEWAKFRLLIGHYRNLAAALSEPGKADDNP